LLLNDLQGRGLGRPPGRGLLRPHCLLAVISPFLWPGILTAMSGMFGLWAAWMHATRDPTLGRSAKIAGLGVVYVLALTGGAIIAI
jgi:hypothetical protein